MLLFMEFDIGGKNLDVVRREKLADSLTQAADFDGEMLTGYTHSKPRRRCFLLILEWENDWLVGVFLLVEHGSLWLLLGCLKLF